MEVSKLCNLIFKPTKQNEWTSTIAADIWCYLSLLTSYTFVFTWWRNSFKTEIITSECWAAPFRNVYSIISTVGIKRRLRILWPPAEMWRGLDTFTGCGSACHPIIQSEVTQTLALWHCDNKASSNLSVSVEIFKDLKFTPY